MADPIAYSSLDDETKGLISYKLKSSGIKSMASGFADIANGYINYAAIRTEGSFLKNQADAVELAAKEQANLLRDEFIGAVGTATYDAARRGVKVNSANVRANIEQSSANVNADIQKSKDNASSQARMMKMRAKNMNRTAKAGLLSSTLNGGKTLTDSYATFDYAGKIGVL